MVSACLLGRRPRSARGGDVGGDPAVGGGRTGRVALGLGGGRYSGVHGGPVGPTLTRWTRRCCPDRPFAAACSRCSPSGSSTGDLGAVTRASVIGAVLQVMYDWAVRGVPSAVLGAGVAEVQFGVGGPVTVSPCWTYVSKTLPARRSTGPRSPGTRVFGSARKRASGVTTRSSEVALLDDLHRDRHRRVCSPDRWSTVESHITGAGITARRSPVLRSVNRTLPSACCSARRPSALSGRV